MISVSHTLLTVSCVVSYASFESRPRWRSCSTTRQKLEISENWNVKCFGLVWEICWQSLVTRTAQINRIAHHTLTSKYDVTHLTDYPTKLVLHIEVGSFSFCCIFYAAFKPTESMVFTAPHREASIVERLVHFLTIRKSLNCTIICIIAIFHMLKPEPLSIHK